MSTESKTKDHVQSEGKQTSANSEIPKEVQDDQFTLDSDIEVEGLVDSLTSIEDRSKKKDSKKTAE